MLHHLDDPWAGWRVLLALLQPEGYMRVGLYSELGRPGVIAGRALVAERGFSADPAGIRQFRETLIAGNFGPPLGDLIAKARDFFTVSELRDLVFHVREHRMTIPQIANFLRDNKLQFLGFELDPESAHNYRARFPADRTMTKFRILAHLRDRSPGNLPLHLSVLGSPRLIWMAQVMPSCTLIFVMRGSRISLVCRPRSRRY